MKLNDADHNESRLKMAAAESAVERIQDGMIVGLGSGTTAAFAVDRVAKRVSQGLRIRCIPTSEQTASQARALGITICTLAQEPAVDLTIDGADQVEETNLNLIKGHGGALLREKIVASVSKSLVIIIHESKLVSRLGATDPVPVEVVPFGWQVTVRHLSKLGISPTLRLDSAGEPYRSDGGNYIVDCSFESTIPAVDLANQLDHVVGVVEHGFFIKLTSEVHVAGASGVRILNASR